MKRFEIKDRYGLEDYRALIQFLRSPEGCPWDRVQTHESIRRNVLEEAYETAHAIDSGDLDNLKEELGDLLMQVLLHADMEAQAGHFDLDDVADAACKKLVFRHPHVFGAASAADPDAVLRTWDAQKMAEKGQKTRSDAMVSVPENLPALWRAEKIQKKAAGGERPSLDEALAAFRGAAEALTACAPDGSGTDAVRSALGAVLFAAVAVAAAAGEDPEQALHEHCGRFIAEFSQAEGTDIPLQTGSEKLERK